MQPIQAASSNKRILVESRSQALTEIKLTQPNREDDQENQVLSEAGGIIATLY